MINILYEDNHLLVVEKPINIAVQADSSKDQDFLTLLKKYIKKRDEKPGNVYLGLVHRLDRPVGGVMVFAKTSKAAARLSDQMRKGDIGKQYYAILKGTGIHPQGRLVDFLWKDEKQNKVFVRKDGKESILTYVALRKKEGLTLVKIKLETGRSHQIRVQFSSRGFPLYGDQKYDDHPIYQQQICLFCFSLSFFHPIHQEKMTFTCPMPSFYPWNLF